MAVGNKELLDKCQMGNTIVPLWHKCQEEQDAERVQFYCPSSTYPAIVLLVPYLIAIFDTSSERTNINKSFKVCDIQNYKNDFIKYVLPSYYFALLLDNLCF